MPSLGAAALRASSELPSLPQSVSLSADGRRNIPHRGHDLRGCRSEPVNNKMSPVYSTRRNLRALATRVRAPVTLIL